MREFESGATRDTDNGKPDYRGFFSPTVMRQFGEYMHKHRHLPNGDVRASDDWKQGIPLDVYMSSAWRHFMDWYNLHESGDQNETMMIDTLCAILFNTQGYLHEYLKQKEPMSHNKQFKVIDKAIDLGQAIERHYDHGALPNWVKQQAYEKKIKQL